MGVSLIISKMLIHPIVGVSLAQSICPADGSRKASTSLWFPSRLSYEQLNPLLWEGPPLRVPTKSNLLLRFSPHGGLDRHFADRLHPHLELTSNLSMGHTLTLESYKVCRYCWWDYPYSDITIQAYQNTPNQPTLPEVQIKHSRKDDRPCIIQTQTTFIQ